MADRATLFVDGNNWFHGLTETGVDDLMRLDYAKISEKLCGPRVWKQTRYYIGALKQEWNPEDYANQRRFLNLIKEDDARIDVYTGRLEERPVRNPLVSELGDFLASGKGKSIPAEIRSELTSLAHRHMNVTTLKEKAVDVMLAVDMYRLAIQDEYDAAYLLSADGDFTPPVEAVCAMGKNVYGVSSRAFTSSALRAVCTAYIPLDVDWFNDCYRYSP